MRVFFTSFESTRQTGGLWKLNQSAEAAPSRSPCEASTDFAQDATALSKSAQDSVASDEDAEAEGAADLAARESRTRVCAS